MEMSFDMFSESLGSAVSVSTNLKGNEIHDVTFNGIEYSTSKDEKYEFINVKFANEAGQYTYRGFGFDSKSNERQQSQFGENPSHAETFMMIIKHLLNAVAPELLNAMMQKTIVFTPKKSADSQFKQYVLFLIEQTTPAIGRKTQIKLITNKNGEAQFPSFPVGLSRAGNVYLKTNFIGNDLAFTDKELINITIMKSAKPTEMPVEKAKPASSDDIDDLNF